MEDSKKTQLHRGKGQSQKAVTKERKRLNQYIGLARVHDRFLSKTIYKNVLFVSSIGWKDDKKSKRANITPDKPLWISCVSVFHLSRKHCGGQLKYQRGHFSRLKVLKEKFAVEKVKTDS